MVVELICVKGNKLSLLVIFQDFSHQILNLIHFERESKATTNGSKNVCTNIVLGWAYLKNFEMYIVNNYWVNMVNMFTVKLFKVIESTVNEMNLQYPKCFYLL